MTEDLEFLLFETPVLQTRNWTQYLKELDEEPESSELNEKSKVVEKILPVVANIIPEFVNFQVKVTDAKTLFYFRKGSHATEAIIPNELLETEEQALHLMSEIVQNTAKEYKARGF